MPSILRRARRARTVGAAAFLAATFIGGAQAADCVVAQERDSLTVRALQSRLLVAALSCDARADYNDFVTRYRPYLANHGYELRKYFRKLYGTGYDRALNSFVTTLANGASQVSIADRGSFCNESRAAFAELLRARNYEAPLTLQAVALDTDWRPDTERVCEAISQRQ
jgi:hypothetical protein